MRGGLRLRLPRWLGAALAANVIGALTALVAGAGGPARAALAGGVPHSETVIPSPVAHVSAPVISIALTPDGQGYWLASRDGGVLTEGDAAFYGSAGNLHLSAPIVAMATTPDGRGYWLVGSDGGVMTYGDAGFFGSAGNLRLGAPIVAMAATPDGRGYWLVGSDGGVMTYGDAGFFGSAGNLRLGAPIVGMAPTPDGQGYWLAGSDGGIMTYGDAPFLGSAGNLRLGGPISAVAATPDGRGYWLVGMDGGVMTYGDAPYVGTGLGKWPITSVTSGPAVAGYLLAAGDGEVVSAATPVASPQSVANGQGLNTNQTPSVPVTTTTPTTTPTTAPGSPTPTTTPTTTPPTTTSSGWTPTATDSGYTFLYPNGSGGTQARWNPCTAIRWAVNLSDAPSNALADAQQAISYVSSATGIPFQYVGTTTFAPNPSGAGGQYPSGIDAVIAWLAPAQFGATGAEAGLGGDWWESSGGPEKIFEGYAIVNGDMAKSLLRPGFSEGYSEGHLLLHELGHMMGLGHTQDPAEVMYPSQGPLSPGTYDTGDLTGLKTLGTGGCL